MSVRCLTVASTAYTVRCLTVASHGMLCDTVRVDIYAVMP